jgi:PhnB protein
MASQFKPDFYNTVSPYLIINRARATMNFLMEVFGAKELVLIDDVEGKIIHGEVILDDTVIMLADAIVPEWSAATSNIHIYVPDVETAFQKALDYGALSIQPPIVMNNKYKRGVFKDSSGTTWWISSNVETNASDVDRCFSCGRYVK